MASAARTAEEIDRLLTPEGFDAALIAREAARGAPVVHIARDDRRMEAMRQVWMPSSPLRRCRVTSWFMSSRSSSCNWKRS